MISILLEHIRSIQNVGSIFRTCDAGGIDTLYLTGITAHPPHKDITKTALGSELSVKNAYFAQPLKAIEAFKASCLERGQQPLVLTCDTYKNALPYTELPLDEDAKNLHILLILGNEKDGVSAELTAVSDAIIYVPMKGTKESLNVSVCTGIILFELIRRLEIT